MATINATKKNIQGALLEGENPLPFFRNPRHDTDVALREGFPGRYTERLGFETGYRVLPYFKQDRYSRRRENVELNVLVLENEHLRAEFLTDYGARLLSLFSKDENRELLYVNSVFQPANLAIRNAWFSGGIEWNLGQYGHAFSTCSPVFFAAIPERDRDGHTDGEFLRIYDFERCRGLYWQIDFHLPRDSSCLYAHTRVLNPHDTETPIYYWTNVALPQTEGSRVFSPASDVIYIDPFVQRGKRRFGYGRLPTLEIQPNIDSSYPDRSKYSNEYFFTCDTEQMPWKVAMEKTGTGFFEASTRRLKYRKMFCWGTHDGGQHWPRYLSDGTQSYYEIQAGLAPTQLHGMVMEPGASWSWTEAFGGISGDPRRTHAESWEESRGYVDERIHDLISIDDLYCRDELFTALEDSPSVRIVSQGTGWGALEAERRKKAGLAEIPASFRFPPDSMTAAQSPWHLLLEEGILPPKEPQELPWSWMVQKEWEEMLLDSIHICGEQSSWNTWLHLGVMAMERGDTAEAVLRWKKSAEVLPNAWAYRNLAAEAVLREDFDSAAAYYNDAWNADGARADRAIAEEHLCFLVSRKRFDEAFELYGRMPAEWQNGDTIQIQYGYIAAARGDEAAMEKVLSREYANIREGETPLTDIWFELEARRVARARSIPITDELRAEITARSTPPYRLDFRMM